MEYYSAINKNEIVICRKIDGTGDHSLEPEKLNSKSQISHFFHSLMEYIPKMVMIIIMGYESKKGTVWGGGLARGGKRTEKDSEG
jgi:hypothetical protein